MLLNDILSDVVRGVTLGIMFKLEAGRKHNHSLLTRYACFTECRSLRMTHVTVARTHVTVAMTHVTVAMKKLISRNGLHSSPTASEGDRNWTMMC